MDRNYSTEYEKAVAALGERRPKLLLHVCCAPCASVTLERLCAHFDVTVYYCNQNIWPEGEYERRYEQLPKLIEGLKLPVKLERGEYAPEMFEALARGMENLPEGGSRCELCFRMRLGAAAEKAAAEGYEYFTSSLSVGPMKSVKLINAVGEELAEEYSVKFLPSDFRKKDGYKRSLDISKQLGLYRQNYCGCRFSVRQPEEKENEK